MLNNCNSENYEVLLTDWGNTIMRDYPNLSGKMYLWEHVETMLGANEMLREVSKNAKIYLITNAADSTKDDIIKALERCNIAAFFTDIFCFQEIGFKKPSPEFYTTVFEKLNVQKNKVLALGDSLENDILGANNFGIECVLYDYKKEKTFYNGLKINHLSELNIFFAKKRKKITKKTFFIN